MSDRDAFLARWSRRKQEARREEPAAPVEPPVIAEIDATVAAKPEALPDLPALDAITADTDISAFLAKGVGDAVRNAALRRIWSLDPAIRDYIGDARDYAYDWNTPGGVPGFGAIDPGYDVEGTIARMFKGPPEPGAEVAPNEEGPIDIAASDDAGDIDFPLPPPEREASPEGSRELGGRSTRPGEGGFPSPQPAPAPGEPAPEPRRLQPEEPARVNTPRHGRATPV